MKALMDRCPWFVLGTWLSASIASARSFWALCQLCIVHTVQGADLDITAGERMRAQRPAQLPGTAQLRRSSRKTSGATLFSSTRQVLQ